MQAFLPHRGHLPLYFVVTALYKSIFNKLHMLQSQTETAATSLSKHSLTSCLNAVTNSPTSIN
jgi:hypothetical protein